MNDTVYTIALAGLLHDVGKFMQRAEVPLSAAAKGMENSICPVWQGRYSHKHVLWTSEFFELFAGHRYLGTIPDTDSIAGLAAYHHSPDSKLKEIIRLADRLSSGSDRQDDEESHNDRDNYKKARMQVIFDYLHLGEKQNVSADYRYELDPLDGDAENCFPTHRNNLNPGEGEKIVKGYAELWDDFASELKKIDSESKDGFTVALLSLLEKYTWCIPSSTMDRPDISLFDHSKTTAAIATSLFRYHDSNDSLANATLSVNDIEAKFRLLVGDLSGIQKYIFDIRNVGVGGTAKRLRARSFYLSVLAETASHALLHEFGLPMTNLVISSGGKFYLLLPNIPNTGERISCFEKTLSQWLIDNLNGEVAINIASVTFSCKQMLSFNSVLKAANDALQKVKEQAFSNSLIDESGWNEAAFVLADRDFTDDEHLCPSCRKFPGTRQIDRNILLCPHCDNDTKLGGELAKAVGVQFFKGNQGKYKLFAGYSFSIARGKGDYSKDAYLVQQFNDWQFDNAAVALRPRPFANYVPRFDNNTCRYCDYSDCNEKANAEIGNPKFFTCLAAAGKGRNALGIFKADVDSLGLIFINGFRSEKEKCISRITTLSRLLDTFFTGRLDYLLREEFKDVYTVYAGGDDLLMLGPWEQTLRFSKRVRDEFADFTCRNPAFTLSAGVAMAKPRLPVYAAIHAADELLEQAKRQKSTSSTEPKNQLATLGDLLKWHDFTAIQEEADRLAAWQEEKRVSTGFVRQLLDSARQFEEFSKTGETRHLRFVPMLAYAISRNLDKWGNEDVVSWAQDLTDLKSKNLKNLNYIVNYSINMNRS